MPRPLGTSRVVLSGTLAGGESFAWGFWLDESTGTQTDTDNAAQAITDYFEAYALTDLAGMIRTGDSYDTVTVYSYPTATGPAIYVSERPIEGGAGTGTSNTLPLQCCLVVTLHTGVSGRRYRGRLYLPLTNEPLTASQLGSTALATHLGNVQEFLSHVNAGSTIAGVVSVISQVEGAKTPVTFITADSRVDIQRRRAASEVELYQATETL